jgi:AcrR family transcriptional regulator
MYPKDTVTPAMSTPARRTQQERRETTRAALLDAAIECLVELGPDGTTTGAVSERASVSRGAHLHHFGTRAALVAAALAELARRREEEFQRQVVQLPRGEDRIDLALDLLWSWFTGPLFYASVDLGTVARTDLELRASLAPVERHLSQSTLIRCREMFAAGREDGSRDELIQMTLATVRGLALLPVLQPGIRSTEAQWEFARRELSALLRQRRATPADR